MSFDTNLPLSLHKANLALWLRTTTLLLQGNRQWLERGMQTVDGNVEETRSEVDQLLESQDWQKLAALPGRAAWRALARQVDGLQATAQTVIAGQTAFASGWQQALVSWPQEAAQALTRAGNVMPIHTTLREFLRSWSNLRVAAAPEEAKPAIASNRKGAFHG